MRRCIECDFVDLYGVWRIVIFALAMLLFVGVTGMVHVIRNMYNPM